MIIIEKIYDIATGEETLIEREETKVERDERIALEKAIAAEALEREAKEAAKTAILEKLGITEDEAKLLLS